LRKKGWAKYVVVKNANAQSMVLINLMEKEHFRDLGIDEI
jgi:hypothetical protein